MNNGWAFLLAATVTGVVFGEAARAEVLTLNDALSVAYETNPQLNAERSALQASDEDVTRARAGLRPKVNATGYYGRSDVRTNGTSGISVPMVGEVGVTMDVFRGGQTFAEIERAKAADRAERGRLLGTEQNVMVAAATAYMDVVRDTKRVKISQSHVDLLRQTYDNVGKMFAAGDITKTDLQQAEARLAQAKLALYQSQAALDASRARFEHVIGRPAGTLDESPKPPALPATLDVALNDAVSRNPEILVSRNEQRAAEEAVNDAEGALLPHVSVTAGYRYSQDYQALGSYRAQIPQSELTVLGQVNVPLYQGGEEYAGIRQAKNNVSKAKYMSTDAVKHVEETVRSSWAAYQASADSIEASTIQLRANEQAVEGVTIEQHGGERSVLDVLNAEQELLNAQITAVNAQHDLVINAFKLLTTTGGATASGLALNVKAYDPLAYYNENSWKWIGIGD